MSATKNAIEQRKIQDQTVFKNQAEAIAALKKPRRIEFLQRAERSSVSSKSVAVQEVRRITADADLYYRTKVAEGDLLVAKAEAEGVRLEKIKPFKSVAHPTCGLDMAKALDGTQVIIVPTDGAKGVNPLDLDSLIKGW